MEEWGLRSGRHISNTKQTSLFTLVLNAIQCSLGNLLLFEDSPTFNHHNQLEMYLCVYFLNIECC